MENKSPVRSEASCRPPAPGFADEKAIRRAAVQYRVPCITTMSGARAAVNAVAARKRDPIRVWSLQEIQESGIKASAPPG